MIRLPLIISLAGAAVGLALLARQRAASRQAMEFCVAYGALTAKERALFWTRVAEAGTLPDGWVVEKTR